MKENIRVGLSIVVWVALFVGFGALGIYGYMRAGDERSDAIESPELVEMPCIERVVADSVGLDTRVLCRVDAIVERYVERGAIPGAVVAVVRGDKLAYIEAFGERCRGEVMTEGVRFDLASLTKPVVVATSVMQLVERGELRLSERVNRHIPDFEGWRDEEDKSHDITILDLMTHTSQLPPYVSLERLRKEYPDSTELSRELLIDYIAHCDREPVDGDASRYSCLNYIVLGAIV